MILGRTPAGAIKTKTDGGLRAVECACCGGECKITQAQFDAIRYGFTTNITGTQGIGTIVPVIQLYEYSFQNPEENREEIYGALENESNTEGQGGPYKYLVSDTGPFTCIVDGPQGSGITYPVTYYTENIETLRLYWFYTAWIPNNTQIAPTYFLNAVNGAEYKNANKYECPNDGGLPNTVVKDYKSSLDLCGKPLYKLVLEGADWPPQP
jgi:hypothetical protein